jgi:hypothetical protein
MDTAATAKAQALLQEARALEREIKEFRPDPK